MDNEISPLGYKIITTPDQPYYNPFWGDETTGGGKGIPWVPAVGVTNNAADRYVDTLPLLIAVIGG